MKGFTLYKPRTKYQCNLCKCRYKVFGDTWIYNARSTRAVDGKPAFRIYWICRRAGHKTVRGYTRYVNHAKNYSGPQTSDDGRSFEDEEQELEAEWNEMILTAAKLKNSTRNRLYY